MKKRKGAVLGPLFAEDLSKLKKFVAGKKVAPKQSSVKPPYDVGVLPGETPSGPPIFLGPGERAPGVPKAIKLPRKRR